MVYNAIDYAKNNPLGDLTFMFKNKKIAKYLVPGRHVHLVGIGGVSMRPLGLVLKGMGIVDLVSLFLETILLEILRFAQDDRYAVCSLAQVIS